MNVSTAPTGLEELDRRTGLAVELTGFARQVREELGASGAVHFDFAYAAGHLLDVVPNPWIGYKFVERVFDKLLAKWKGKEKVVANNLVFILEELRKRLEAERDRLAEAAFNEMLDDDEMRFMVVVRDLGMHRLPKKTAMAKSAVRATRLDGSQFEMNLFEPMAADDLNHLNARSLHFSTSRASFTSGTGTSRIVATSCRAGRSHASTRTLFSRPTTATAAISARSSCWKRRGYT